MSIFGIKVLGSGCKNCKTLLENTKEAVSTLELSVNVEYITDMQQIVSYGVMSMPAIVINGKIISMGKVLPTPDIVELIKKQM